MVAALDPRLMSGTPTGVGRAGGRAVGVRNGAGLVPGCGDEPSGLSDSWTRAAPVAAMRRRPAPKIRIGPWPSRSSSGRHLGVTRRLEAYATTAGGLFALTPTLSRSRAGFVAGVVLRERGLRAAVPLGLPQISFPNRREVGGACDGRDCGCGWVG
jgi:hypothetical protein